MKVTLCLALVTVALTTAAPQGYNYQGPLAPSAPSYAPAPQYAAARAQYDFQWDVNDPPSGNFFGHQESRDGAVTRGSYYVRLPDTRLMRVDYYVDETGYHPTVTFEGQAQFPPTRQYAPAYTAPAPAPAPAPARVYSSPAPAPAPGPVRVFPSPAPSSRRVFSSPALTFPSPSPAPAPAPSGLYAPPGRK